MIPTAHIAADLERAVLRLAQAQHRIPNVIEHIAEQVALIPDLAAAAYDGAGGKSSDHPDPTASTVAARDVLLRHAGYITDGVATIHVAIDVLSKACEEALGQRAHLRDPSSNPPPARDTPRCVGWAKLPADVTCYNIPDERRDRYTGETRNDGRCLTCGQLQDAYDSGRRTTIEQNRRLRRREAAS